MAKLHTNINTKEYPFQKLYSWKSPERFWTPKDKAWYVSWSFFFVTIIAIAALLGEYIFIVAVIAFVFLWFVQAAIPPEIAEHTITTIGIKTFGKMYRWKDIKHFWFSEKNETLFLHLEIIEDEKKPEYTRRFSLIIGMKGDKEIFKHLIKYVDYGNTDEISYNIITQFLNGEYREISNYLAKEEKE